MLRSWCRTEVSGDARDPPRDDAANGHLERRQRRRPATPSPSRRVAVVRDAREGRRVVRVADPPRDERPAPVADRSRRRTRPPASVLQRLRADVLRRRVVEVVVALRGVRRLDGAEGALAVRLLLHLERRDLHDVGARRSYAAKLFVHMPHPVTVASTPFHELARLPSSRSTNGYFSLPSLSSLSPMHSASWVSSISATSFSSLSES